MSHESRRKQPIEYDSRPRSQKSIPNPAPVFSPVHERPVVGYKEPKNMLGVAREVEARTVRSPGGRSRSEAVVVDDTPCDESSATTPQGVVDLAQQTESKRKQLSLKRKLAAPSQRKRPPPIEEEDFYDSDFSDEEPEKLPPPRKEVLPKRMRVEEEETRMDAEVRECKWCQCNPCKCNGERSTHRLPEQELPPPGPRTPLNCEIKPWFGCLSGFYWTRKALSHWNGTDLYPTDAAQDIYITPRTPARLVELMNESIAWKSAVPDERKQEFDKLLNAFSPKPFLSYSDLHMYYIYEHYPQNFTLYTNCITKYIEMYGGLNGDVNVCQHPALLDTFYQMSKEGKHEELKKMGFKWTVTFTGEVHEDEDIADN